MANILIFCLALTMASISLLVTCTKMSTEMTTQIPKPMDVTKSMDNSKSMDGIKVMDNSKSMDRTRFEDTDKDSDMNEQDDLIDAMTMCNESFRTEMAFLVSLNESGSFPDETDKTPKHQQWERQKVDDDELFQCFLRCVLQTLEVASSEEGRIDPQRAADIFADRRGGEEVVDIATKCAQRDEQDLCELAYSFLKCLFSMEVEKNSKNS